LVPVRGSAGAAGDNVAKVLVHTRQAMRLIITMRLSRRDETY
jgi:hypothetical protein